VQDTFRSFGAKVIAPRADARDTALADRLWDKTEEIVAALPR
jgi:hypothetical protein